MRAVLQNLKTSLSEQRLFGAVQTSAVEKHFPDHLEKLVTLSGGRIGGKQGLHQNGRSGGRGQLGQNL